MSPQQKSTASKTIRSTIGQRRRFENPAKKEKYLKSFALYVNDQEVYAKEIADALEADLQPLATSGLVTRISKYDTNPANNPQPPQRPRERS